jgi:hypothetical protein
MGAPTTLIIPVSAIIMTRMGSPPGKFGSKLSVKHKPFKKGGEKGLAYMTSMLKAITKGQKKAARKGKKRKKRDYRDDSSRSSSSDSE